MMERLKKFAKRIKQELVLYQLIAKHPETPWLAKLCFGLAIGYLLLPFDLIPDFIPVLGQLDDLVVVPLLIYIAMKLTPSEVVAQCQKHRK
ncbi:MAG: YkvA family protein [Methylophilaceae bacterium]